MSDRVGTVHHVFPYNPRHLGLDVRLWWRGQQSRWPLATIVHSRYAPSTVVHVLGRAPAGFHEASRLASGASLRVHAPDSPSTVHDWGDDWSPSLGRALRRAGPEDVVVIHMSDYASARLSQRAARHARVVIVVHGAGVGRVDMHLETADAVVVLREELTSLTTRLGRPLQNVHLATPSIDRSVFTPRDSSSLSESAALGFVGRIEASKGVADITADLLTSDMNRVELIGSPIDGTETQRLSDARWAFLLGELPVDEVAARMHGWRVLAVPSLTEGCPIVVLEALGVGLPVAAVTGVLPTRLEMCRGVFTAPRGDFGSAVAAAAECRDVDDSLVKDHVDAARWWDDFYEGLKPWSPRPVPSLRSQLGRVRRLHLPDRPIR